MAEDNHNIIKPVESLQNIAGLTPAKRRQERKKQQNSREQEARQRELNEDELNQSSEEDIGSEIAENDRDEHAVDYCA